jgi:basic amino acid/polyamine antiporter, APA family
LTKQADPVSRPFGVWTAAALVVGGMIGSGIFVLPALLAPFGTAGLAAWAVAIPGALILAAIVARLIATKPEAAGAAAVIGEALGPLAAVLIGWSYWVGIWAANAVLAQTAIRYASVYEPRLAASPVALAIWSIALIWLLTFLNLRGAVAAGRFQVVTTLLKLLPLVAVIAIAIGLAGSGSLQLPASTATIELNGVTGALGLAFGALLGFESAGVASERVRDPARNIARATLIGVGITGLLYLAVCLAIASALPAERIAASPAPVADFVEAYWGRTAALCLATFAVISAVGCLNGWIFVQGEHPLAMVRGRLLPTSFGKTSSRDVAVGPLLAGSVCCSILLASDHRSDDVHVSRLLPRLVGFACWQTFSGYRDGLLHLGIDRHRRSRLAQHCADAFRAAALLVGAAQPAKQRSVGQHFLSAIMPRRARHAAAGMGACTAHIEALQRPAIRAMPKHWTCRP